MHLRGVLAAASGLLIGGALAAPALASPSIERCLEQADRELVGDDVRATFGSSPLAGQDNLMVDARGVEWRPRRSTAGPRYAVSFDGSNSCWIGGAIVGIGEASLGAPSGIAIGTGDRTAATEVHSLKIRRTQHGIRVGSASLDLKLTNVLIAETSGTCLVAKHRGDLVVANGFFDKCARVVKLDTEHAGSTLTVRNSLIRINDRARVRTGGRLFARRPHAASVQVRFDGNVVVTGKRLDRHSLSVIEPNCTDNTLIWLGDGDYPGDLPDCFEVVKGRRAWREARSAWLKQHGRKLANLGARSGPASACALPEVPLALTPRKTVGDGSPASCTESALRGALAGGGTITFSCGPAPVTIALESELVVASPTVLEGRRSVTLDGQGRTRIIRNTSQLTLKAMTLTRGRADVVWNGSPNGGGAVNTAYGRTLYVVDSRFTHNGTSAQGFGGAIFQAGAGALTVLRSRFADNVGGGGGAIYSLLAGLRVVESAFRRNQGSSGWQGGGGIMTDGASANSGNGGSGGEIVVCGSTFEANQALATGGGAYLYAYPKDRVTVRHSTFAGNSVTPNSGGVSMGGGVRLGASPALIARSSFRDNTARMGGAVATEGDAPTEVRNSTFECNSSDVEGGNVRAGGNTLLGC